MNSSRHTYRYKQILAGLIYYDRHTWRLQRDAICRRALLVFLLHTTTLMSTTWTLHSTNVGMRWWSPALFPSTNWKSLCSNIIFRTIVPSCSIKPLSVEWSLLRAYASRDAPPPLESHQPVKSIQGQSEERSRRKRKLNHVEKFVYFSNTKEILKKQ